MRKRLFKCVLNFIVIGLVGCVTSPPPTEEFALARAALDAAKAVEAARYSAGFFHKAELAYKKAISHYEDRDYESAAEQFKKAKESAEMAENSARMIRFKNGEVL